MFYPECCFDGIKEHWQNPTRLGILCLLLFNVHGYNVQYRRRISGGSRPLTASSQVTVLLLHIAGNYDIIVNNVQFQESLQQRNPPQNTH